MFVFRVVFHVFMCFSLLFNVLFMVFHGCLMFCSWFFMVFSIIMFFHGFSFCFNGFSRFFHLPPLKKKERKTNMTMEIQPFEDVNFLCPMY